MTTEKSCIQRADYNLYLEFQLHWGSVTLTPWTVYYRCLFLQTISAINHQCKRFVLITKRKGLGIITSYIISKHFKVLIVDILSPFAVQVPATNPHPYKCCMKYAGSPEKLIGVCTFIKRVFWVFKTFSLSGHQHRPKHGSKYWCRNNDTKFF